jgi:hypothetical protein
LMNHHVTPVKIGVNTETRRVWYDLSIAQCRCIRTSSGCTHAE